MEHFLALSRLRGLSPRQSRLLDLRSVIEGTQYADLRPWSPPTDADGRLVPASRRAPAIQLGTAAGRVERLADLVAGPSALPTVTAGPTADKDAARAVTSALWDGLRLDEQLAAAAEDLIALGSAVLGFARPSPGHWEAAFLQPEWCEPVFVAQARSPRAREIAAGLADAGVAVPTDADGPYLPAPVGAPSDALAFLRYQYRYDTSQAVAEGGAGAADLAWWRRTDYLPDVIVTYEDVRVSGNAQYAPGWRALPPRPHGWGVVPLVWLRGPGARPGQTEGRSLLTPPLLSIDRATDETMAFAHDAVKLNAAPLLSRIDAADVTANAAIESGAMGAPIASDPGAVLDHRSIGGQQAQVGLLETSGAAGVMTRDHLASLTQAADRVSGVVDFDQTKAAGVMSGVALERMIAPTIARVGRYRGIIGAAVTRLVQGLATAMEREGDVAIGAVPWSVTWPRVVPLTAHDVLEWAQALSAAAGGPVMSPRSAARLFAQEVGLDDPDAEADLVAAEPASGSGGANEPPPGATR